jgi:ribosomal-protein-alanine N-acetyltransferase
MNPIKTSRLKLIPAATDLVRLEIENLPRFFERLGVNPVPDWPSANLSNVLPFFLEQLENDPSLAGWLTWYWIHELPQGNQLVGNGGFKGPPAGGIVEIGYETRMSCRRKGFASEAVDALVDWALDHPSVHKIVAETRPDNAGSIRVLDRTGFVPSGVSSERGHLLYARVRSRS